jgi:hypothetical protein
MPSQTQIKVKLIRSKHGDGSACKVKVSGKVRGIALCGLSQQFLDTEPVSYRLVRSILDGRVFRATGGQLPYASTTLKVYDAVLEKLEAWQGARA